MASVTFMLRLLSRPFTIGSVYRTLKKSEHGADAHSGFIALIMAYDLHIERGDKSPIALREWLAAIEVTEGVRLFAAAAHTITNPNSGEVINIDAREGDAEVIFPDTGEWHSVFRWRGKSAVFAAAIDPTETSHPVWRAAVRLAGHLGAEIRGDGGELYDFETGKVRA